MGTLHGLKGVFNMVQSMFIVLLNKIGVSRVVFCCSKMRKTRKMRTRMMRMLMRAL